MTKDEALKLALEALVLNNVEWKHLADSGDSGDWSAEDQDHYKQTEEAITAIKEALAQPEQEPVAFCKVEDVYNNDSLLTQLGVKRGDLLYTTPPQRTWVGLTPQERDEINERVYGAVPHHVAFHAAIEQALREKNT